MRISVGAGGVDAGTLFSQHTSLQVTVQPEDAVKQQLRERLSSAKQVLVLVGESTRGLSAFALWEIEVALEKGLPIVAVNLDKSRVMDPDRCPPIIQIAYVVHISYEAQAVQYALDNFPDEFAHRTPQDEGPLRLPDDVYTKLGL